MKITLRELLAKTGDKYDYLPDSATVEMQREETDYWHLADYAISSRVGNTLFMVLRAPKGRTEIEAGKEQGHTPTPWKYDGAGYGNIRPMIEDGRNVCTFTRAFSLTEQMMNDANARFICKAVNCHAELVEALEDVASGCVVPKERLKAILKKAGEA